MWAWANPPVCACEDSRHFLNYKSYLSRRRTKKCNRSWRVRNTGLEPVTVALLAPRSADWASLAFLFMLLIPMMGDYCDMLKLKKLYSHDYGFDHQAKPGDLGINQLMNTNHKQPPVARTMVRPDTMQTNWLYTCNAGAVRGPTQAFLMFIRHPSTQWPQPLCSST